MLLLVRGYYAAGRTFVPFFINALTTVSIIALSYALITSFYDASFLAFIQHVLRVDDIQGGRVLALAAAYSFISIMSTLIMIAYFEHRFRGFLRLVVRSWGESLAAAFASGAGAYGMLHLVGQLTLTSTTLSVFTRGFAAGLAGVAAGMLAYYVLGNRELRETLSALKNRVRPFAVTVAAPAEEAGPAGPQ
jgi:peptidoglycan biosynthesis protein MviN/MurJ (putative lipid II flippase)